VFGRSGRIGLGQLSGGIAGRIRTLKGELNWLYHRIEFEQTSTEGISIDRINSLRTDARHKEDEFLRTIREHDSLNSRSGVVESAVPMEPREITKALHRDAVIVEYFQTGTDFVAAVVNNSSTEIVRLAPVLQVGSSIRMLQFQLSKLRLNSSYLNAFQAELLATIRSRLQKLYGDLIEPLSSLLQARHIVFVPDGILHYLPFHALFDGSQYLIDRFTVSVAPSASIYSMCHQKQANSDGTSLLMGVHDERAPFIEREIHSVAAAVPEPRIFLGADATAEVLRSLGPNSRMIHIATHGFFRKDNAMFSSVRLADSYLNLYDLYELRLPVELLTLSGCGTGLSVVAAGDELLGLTRGLLCAGAQSVLLSLWDVHDRTTAEFMSSFYSHLGKEREKASALRAAMLETRERLPHPYFWAPFVLVGKALNH
jgi:CHAT domain-containing protein